jgi:Lrp/AsnC family transcriptional regulator, leucine-responsive regulatory protein
MRSLCRNTIAKLVRSAAMSASGSKNNGKRRMELRLDAIDRKLLRLLQADSRRSVQQLGEAVGLSASACHRRLKGLEESGLVKGYRAVLDAERLGFTMQFFIEVGLSSQSEPVLDAFEAAVVEIPEVLECHLMAGQSDYILRVTCRDHEDFERLHRRLLARLPGVARVHSNMSIRTVKTLSGLPV